MLSQIYTALARNYCHNIATINTYWTAIEAAYTHPKRHYHNLSHLENLYQQLNNIKPQIQDWDMVLFALFYHDMVYRATQKDNEEKSAALAAVHLKQLNVPADRIDRCCAHILATKSHTISPDADTNLFTDADLSILGQPWEIYNRYTQNVRREYAIYPDLLYKPGRKKVLAHFLHMPRIFKTDTFFEQYEAIARGNIGRELLG